MSIFSSYAYPRQEDTYVPYFIPEKPSPQLFFGGSLSTGFYPTTAPPEPSEEEAQDARSYMAAVQGGKNWTTGAAWLVNKLGYGDQSFVNREAAQINKQLLAQPGEGVEAVGIGAAFADTLRAVKEVVDPNFSATTNWEQWKKDNAGAYALFQQRGVDDENFTKNITNKVYFDANVRLQMGLIQAADIIDARNNQVTGLQQAWESTRGVLANYVVNDPVGLGANLIPVAGQVGRSGQVAATAGRLSLLGQTIVKVAPSTEAMLLSKSGQLGLATVEMGLVGMADDTVAQTQEVARSQALWGGTDQALDYSFSRTALAGASGMALSLGLHGVAKGTGASIGMALGTVSNLADRVASFKQAQVVAAGGKTTNAVVRNGPTATSISRDYADDAVKIKIAEHLDNLSPNVMADPGIGWIMDDKILRTAGLNKEDVLDVVQQLSDVVQDDSISNTQLNAFFQEWFVQAKGFQDDLGFVVSDGPNASRYMELVSRVESRIIAEGGVQPTDRSFIPGTREFREKVENEVFSALKKEEVVNLRTPPPVKSALPSLTLKEVNEIRGVLRERTYTPGNIVHGTSLDSLGSILKKGLRQSQDFEGRQNVYGSLVGEEGSIRGGAVSYAGKRRTGQKDTEGTVPVLIELDSTKVEIDAPGDGIVSMRKGVPTTVAGGDIDPTAIKAIYIGTDPTPLTLEQAAQFLTRLEQKKAPNHISILQKEFDSWIQTSKNRDLLLDEEARMLALEQILANNNSLPAGYTMKAPLPKSRKTFTLNKIKPTTEAAKRVNKLLKERKTLTEQTQELAAARSTPGADISRLIKDRDNTLSRIRRAIEALKEDIDIPAPKLSEVLRDMATTPPQSSGERIQVLMKMLQAAPEERGLRVQDIHTAAEIMRAWGLGEAVANIMLQKTGQMNGTRSMFASVRELYDFMDHATLKVEDVSPHQRKHVGTLADKKRESIRAIRDLDAAIEKNLKSGKITDWDKTRLEFILHSNGAIDSTDPVVLDLFSTWEKAQKQWMQEGVKNGYLGRMTKAEQKQRFFPRRWLVGSVRRNVKDFQNVLYEVLLKKWQAADDLHMDTMVQLGWARRIEKDGRIDWEGVGAFAGKELPRKREELDPALLPNYEKGLTAAVNENGENALQQSAWRAVNHILSEDTPRINQVTGKIIPDEVSRSASEIEKRLPVELLQDVRMHKYLDTNLMDIAQSYAESTGFAIKAQTAIQQKWGIDGLTLDEWIDSVKVTAEAQFRGNPEALERLNQAMSTFRTKYLRMRGKSGTLISVNENILENMAQIGESLGSFLYSGGIAVLSMFADTFVAQFSKVHSPTDFWRNAVKVFQSIFQHKQMTKEHLHDLAMGTYLHRHGNIERYTSGQLGSTFTYSWGSRMAQPWREVVDAFSGQTQGSVSQNNRAVLGSMRTMEALAKNVQTLFGGDFWFTSAAAVQVAALKRETAQYLAAGIQMANTLNNVGWKELADLHLKTLTEALASGKSQQEALRLATTAKAKAFNKIAREAGFGPNWHIPVRMNQHGLLDSEILNVLQEAGELTGGLTKKGIKSFMDINTLSQAMDRLSPEKQILLQDAFRRIHNMIEADTNRILNVPGILQTPTDPSSRVYLGRMMNMYTGYMRTFASNHVLGLANVPQRRGFSLLLGFLIGETLARTSRRLLNGEPWEEINAEWEENPSLMMARTLMQVPFFGEWSLAPQLLMEASLDGPMWKQGSESVPQGALNDMFQLAREGINSPYEFAQGENPRFLTHADRMATRLVPGLGLARSLMGADMSRNPDKKRQRAKGILERTDLEWERKLNWDDSEIDPTKDTIYGPAIPGVLP